MSDSFSVKSTLPALARELRLSTLAELEERATEHPPLSTGWEAFDRVSGGGLPRGALTECSGPANASCGLTLLQHQLLSVVREQQQFVALIDAFDRFDPASSDASLLESLLWIRGEGLSQALKAADILLRDNNFGMVLLDLREASGLLLQKVPARQWYRLQRAAQENETTLVAFTPQPVIASARLRLTFAPWAVRTENLGPLDNLPRALLAEALQLDSRTRRSAGLRLAQ